MYNALVDQHEAIDRLFAMLVEAKPGFFPSKSGQPWEALVRGNAAIHTYETSQESTQVGTSPLMERLRAIAPPEMWSGAVTHGNGLRIERHPIQDQARHFARWIFMNPAGGPSISMPKTSDELTVLLWVFGTVLNAHLEKQINAQERRIGDMMMAGFPMPTIPNEVFQTFAKMRKDAEALTGADPNMPGSLSGASVRPLCANHKPVVKQLDEGFVELGCPNCSYRATMSKETYQELLEMIRIEEGVTNAALDIMRGPPKEPGNG